MLSDPCPGCLKVQPCGGSIGRPRRLQTLGLISDHPASAHSGLKVRNQIQPLNISNPTSTVRVKHGHRRLIIVTKVVSVSIFPRVGSRGIPRSFGFCKQYGFSKLLAYHQVRHEYRIHDLALSYTLSYRLNETVQTVPPALQVRHLKVPSSEYETPSQVVVFPILERTILLGLKGIREILGCRLEKRYTFSETLSTPPSGVGRRGGKGFPFKIELSPSPKDQHFSPELRLANTAGG